ncbi:MAG: NYN domain-containing protein [Lachnospiraceae bacterium]|jgi:uncharacterized LabA/DUF88 family protein|nr:NYN domain-containing protein [Lachnospiraceae bacterium]
MTKTAILIDGGFYRHKALHYWGPKTAEDRAKEIYAYCQAHLRDSDGSEKRHLYRVFYYDCAPITLTVYHPFLKKNIYLGKSETYKWMVEFLEEMKQMRKFALRLGNMSEDFIGYNLKQGVTRKLCAGKIAFDELTENDFQLNTVQKGVDMRIGVDIASMSFKKQVDQIILIAGDSDFVPAAKLARREGVDFILDPMWQSVKEDLFEHVDGLKSQWKKQSNVITTD